MAVTAEEVRSRGRRDDAAREAADGGGAEGAEALGNVARSGAGQEDGVRQEARSATPGLSNGAIFSCGKARRSMDHTSLPSAPGNQVSLEVDGD